jgi:peptidoglycan/LPS O-acetylase OafA/YrhL
VSLDKTFSIEVHCRGADALRRQAKAPLLTTLERDPTSALSSSASDLPALTALRFLAAAVVFLHHFPPAIQPWPLAVISSQGHVGVTVFFVLSGFLITMRYSDALGAQGGVTLNEYFRKRVARIIPLYWTVLGVSLALSVGGLSFSWQVLPEWLLLQGYLSRSVGDLAVPTSWTLTLEESFYLTAPVLFVWLRRARAFGAWVLGAATAFLLSLGLGLSQLVDADRFQFLGSIEELFRHTFFGRFVDFALGVWGGRWFLSGGASRIWARPRGPVAATAAGIAGFALIFAGQVGMGVTGGLDSPRWRISWPFNLLVGLGSLVLILSLTCSRSLLSRLLGAAPFVYLGRVSYALYVIQLTPLGRGLMYRLIPSGTPWFGLLLYLGMTAVSALLYELVEEPARRLVLRMWPSVRARHAKAPEPEGVSRKRDAPVWALILVTSIAALLQTAAWAGGRVTSRRGPPTLAESQRAAQVLPDRLVAVPVSGQGPRALPEGSRYRVPIPETWMIGAHGDRRAPPSLLVYADGETIAFERRPSGDPSPATAYLRGPRTTFVEVLLAKGAEPNQVTLVRHDPLIAGTLLVQRIGDSFSLLGVIAAAVAAAGVTAGFSFRGWRPAVSAAAALALAACVLFIALEIHLQSWALVAMAIELIALCAVARFSRRPAGARAV